MNFKEYFEKEFSVRRSRNPKYSLRAFAQQLGLDPSYVSKLMSGKREASLAIVSHICEKLKTKPTVAKVLIHQSAMGGRGSKKRIGPRGSVSYEQINEDSYRLTSDWFHFAILELSWLESFKADPIYIASELGISRREASEALQRLLRLGLLKKNANQRWIPINKNISSYTTGVTSEAHRSHQRQLLSKAIWALDNINISCRDQSGITMAIDEKNLPAIKELIRDFRRKLCRFIQKKPPFNQVYHLGISFFPVSGHDRSVLKNS